MRNFIRIGFFLSGATRQFRVGSRRRCFGFRFGSTKEGADIDFLTAMRTFHAAL
jgi:hypothetical protein